MKRVYIIGCNGYIGSALTKHLVNCNIDGNNDKNYQYTKEFLKDFDVVIYLGGPQSRTSTNPDTILEVASLMHLDQTLIYASTTAVYEGLVLGKEDDIIDITKLDTYSKSMITREQTLSTLTNTNTIGLRLATVSGMSPTLRLDRIHIQMLKSALLTGKITVNSALQKRPIVSMMEIIDVFQRLIISPPKNHTIYNISSFNTTICSIASEIAHITNAKIKYISTIDSIGFSVDNTKFIHDYDMVYISTNIMIIQDLLNNNIISHIENKVCDVECIVCESKKMILMVDLGSTALANQFVPQHIDCEKFPLSMYRCMNCFHNQLGYIVPSNMLFDNYIYVSATAKTNLDYFDWFAEKITKNKDIGTVLDIACNDGSQLDKLKQRGWKTYGVDPAANLYQTSSEKGHEVVVGYWGMLENSVLPSTFDIIIAQNVFAHVPKPRLFLEACKNSMHEKSILYIQTSQAELFMNGEYDTIYHEHISFFTIKSMQYLSNICGIYLDNVEKVSIHGTSYIFSFRLRKDDDPIMSENVKEMIEKESQIYQPENVEMYSMHVNEKRKIISEILDTYKDYSIIGFGSSAKGNTLLSSLFTTYMPKYIIDENPLKQGLYTPGAKIPVVAYETLEQEKNNLLVVVLAWNFLDEIKEKIKRSRNGNFITALLVPFPTTRIEVLYHGEYYVVSEFPLYNNLILKPPVEKLLISHFYNEEFLLPYWIMHHSPMFQHAVLINHHSTDKSCDIIRELAPSTWKIINTTSELFDAHLTDAEVRSIEKSYPDHIWKLCLTTTEFLIWPTMDVDLIHHCHKIHALDIIGNDTIPLHAHLPLVSQRNHAMNESSKYNRYIHKNQNNCDNLYVVGRHHVNINHTDATNAIIFKYLFSPWPESIPRKLQIGKQQSLYDIQERLGAQHQCTIDSLTEERNKQLNNLAVNFYNDGLTDHMSLLRSKLLYNQLHNTWIQKV